jgi:pimeloyl-ACP methyl ester carboxylesterase
MRLEVISERPESKTRDTPILFVHGAWHAAWCWCERFVPYFVQHGYVCHALSFRGHGASEGRQHLRRTGILHYVEDLAQVAGQLDRAPILVAHSMGTLVAQKYLETHAAPVAVLLASVPPHGVILAGLRAAVRHPLAFLKVNLTLSLRPLVGAPELARDMLFSKGMPVEQANAIFPKLEDESYRAFWDMLLFTLPRPKRISTKMLVLGAANDRIFSPKEIEATARAYHGEYEIFPNMGHDMMIDVGWQTVADRTLRWLSENNL